MIDDRFRRPPPPPPPPPPPKVEPKKVEPKKVEPKAAEPAKPQNEVKPQSQQVRDGFDHGSGGSSTSRADQQRRLGSTDAPSGTGSPSTASNATSLPREAMDKLGLTKDDFDKAAEKARPELEKAGRAALAGNMQQAITSLKDAAAAGAPELAEKAITHVAKQLPETGALGAAKKVLTDPKMVHELVSNKELHGAIEKLSKGDVAGGLRDMASNKPVRDAALDLVAKDPAVQNGLNKLGFNTDDLKRAGDAFPDVFDAAMAAGKGDFRGAIEELKGAGPVAQDLATKGIVNAAKNLPDGGAGGMARSLLTDEKFVRQLVSDPKVGDALGQLVKGNVAEGLKGIASNPDLRDAAVDALAKNKDVKAGMDKLGLTTDDLKAAGEGLPSVLDAGQKIAAGDVQGALKSLKDAAGHAAPVVEKAIVAAAKNLPESGAGGLARSLLTDKDFVKQLVENEELHGALGQIAEGKVGEGIKALASNPAARDAAIGALANNKDIKAGLDKLGLNADDLQQAGEALPSLVDAGIAAGKGDYQAAFKSLQEAADTAAPVVEKAIVNVARNLPDSGAGGIAKSLLTDPKFVKELVENKDAHGAIGQIASGDISGGLESLAGNEKLTGAAIDALAKNKDIKAGMDKLGLTTADLQAGKDALPELVEAGTAAAKGDFGAAFKSLQAAAGKAPEVVQKGIIAAARNLPESGAGGMARSMLTDPKFVKELVENKDAHAAIGQLANGDITGGLESLAGNEKLTGAAIDALATNKDVKAGMDKLGLSTADLQAGKDALPELVEAGTAAAKGDFGAAFKSLQAAAGKAPEVVQKGIIAAAKNLPESGAGGVARSLLTDPAFVKQIVENKDLHAAIGQLADGNVGEGLKALAGNKPAAEAAIDALAKNPDVKAGMDKLGFTAADLKSGTAALPELVQAGIDLSKGDVGAAFKSLQSAAGKAPALVEKGIIAAAKQLPESGAGGVARSLLTDEAFVKQLVENQDLHGAIGQLANGQIGEGLEALAGNQTVANAAVDALVKNPDVKAGLDKIGLTAEDLKSSTDALPDLVQAGIDASKGDFGAAFKSLQGAAGKAPALVEKGIMAAAKHLPDSGAGGIAKSVLTDPEAVKALVENQELHSAIGKLASGDLSALKDIATNPGAGAIADAVLDNPDVKAGLDKIGLTPEDVKGSLGALGDVAQAAKSMAQGDFQDAFKHLKDAAANMPPALVEKAITTAADKLPDSGPGGMVKSLLTDENFVKQLVRNEDLHTSFDQIMSGQFEEGLKGILTNTEFRDAAAGALAKNADLMKKLEPFGITNAQDLAGVGGSLVDLMQAGESFAKGDVGDALSNLGEAFQALPAETRGKMLGKVADKLGLPSWARDTLVGLGGALSDPAVGKSLGDAMSALSKGDLGGFARNLAETGQVLARNQPAAATALLDSLSHIPGSLGRFFGDHELNQALVDSGSLEHVFAGMEKLVSGDPGGALGEMAKAVGSLLGEGDHFEVLDHELPFGMEGIENVTRLFGRFMDALPEGIKTKIETEAAKFGAKSFVKSIPLIGNVVSGFSAIGSAKDLIEGLNKDPKDYLQIALDAAQTGLDVAGMVPGLNSITGPLQVVLGTAKVIKGASDLVGDVREFQQGLMGN